MGGKPIFCHFPNFSFSSLSFSFSFPYSRYIDAEDKGDMEDIYDPRQVEMNDARSFSTPPTLEGEGFELRRKDTKVANFRDDDEVKKVYYPELQELIKVFFIQKKNLPFCSSLTPLHFFSTGSKRSLLCFYF